MSKISSSSTMRLVTCLWVMLHILPQGVITFFPSRLSGVDIGDGTLTHADITEVGILKAVASYFEANPRPNTTLAAGDLTQMKSITTRKLFQAYYGEGVSETRFQDTITSIINANNQVNLNMFNVSVWHCNGETIREANQKMMNLREQAIAVLSQNNANFDQARNLIGQFLHILQMFYSNTNWIEFSGAVPYYSLGIRNKPLLGQAPPVMDACVSCGGELDRMCEDNMIVDGKILTSGYRSGQDAVKPHKHNSISNTGKCSHGGPLDDTSSSVAALGGINKDSTLGSLSPHSHLHQAAAQAAIEHTTYFFDDEEYGIRGIIGTKKFNELFQLKPEASFALVIDYSGSMTEDIAAVTSVIRATLEKPINYILSLFNDPLSKSRVYLTDDGNDALRYLGEIRIYGGGDCPEYAMDGLMNALAVCNYNTDVFVFTDASAKDAPLHVAVLSLAALKNVHLHFILTGDCGSWSKPTGEDLYRTLATATGGSVYSTNKTGIATVVDIMKESLTPSVTIAKSSISASDVNVPFPVDQTILQAAIKIVTLDRNTPVYKLYTPDNTEATSNVSVSDLGDGIQLVKIQNPAPGVWRLARQDSNSWEVEVKGQSTLDISTTFVKLDPNSGFEYEMTVKPIAGENATVIVRIPSSENIGTVDNLILTDPQGAELARHGGMTQVASRADSLVYRITFPLPMKAFQMATEGTDKAGNQFLRLRPKTIAPVTIDLKLLPLKGSLYTNERLAVPFLVINKGAARSTVTVTVRDDQNFVKTTTSLEYMLQPGQNTLGQFLLHAGSTVGVTSTVTVSASASAAADDDFQYDTLIVTTEERVVRKEDNTIPVCNITAVTGSCNVTMLDPCMCSQYNWSGTAEIQDDGFGLYLVTASVNTTGTFRHDPFSEGYNGTISATITSDCCHPLAYITVVDLASNTGQCVFYLAPRLTNYVHSFKPTTQCQSCLCPVSQPASQTSSDWSTDRVIMAIAAQDAGLLVLLILISICVVCVKGRNRKKSDVQ